mmetsp:Transcript_77628/g.231316  ORF Transcript_77628/g.231316 Transcript_77628/m.231316 type:complete len:287 (-) Transcript_77628:345-1205(-)
MNACVRATSCAVPSHAAEMFGASLLETNYLACALRSAMNRKTKASMWKMSLLPCRMVDSKWAAAAMAFCFSPSFRWSTMSFCKSSLMMKSAGRQADSSSYTFPRTSMAIRGLCSCKIFLATLSIATSQASFGRGISFVRLFELACACADSSMRRALRKSRLVLSAIRDASSGGRLTLSAAATFCSTRCTSSEDGAPTRTARQRLLSGGMILEALSHVRMIRQVFMYLSMVRLRAACASLESEPASSMTTTLKVWPPSGGCEATSLMSCMTTARSLLPRSEGVTARW